MRPAYARGLAFAVAGSVAWGFSGTCAQFLLSSCAMPPLVLVTVRLLVAGPLLLAFCRLRGKPADVRGMFAGWRNVGNFLFFGFVGIFFTQLSYLETIARTNAGTATMLGCLSAVMLLVVVCVRDRRGPRAAEGVGVALAVAATWFIAVGADPSRLSISTEALAWGIANAAAVTVYTLHAKLLMARWGSIPVVAVGMVVGGLMCAAISIPQWSFPALEPAGWAALAAMVLVGTCLSYCLFFQAILLLPPVDIGMLQVVEPVAATFFSVAWLGTVFSATDYLGFALMMAMVLVIALAGRGGESDGVEGSSPGT